MESENTDKIPADGKKSANEQNKTFEVDFPSVDEVFASRMKNAFLGQVFLDAKQQG